MRLLLDENGTDNATTDTGAATASMTRSESDLSFDGTNKSLLSFSEGVNDTSLTHTDHDDMDVILETVLGGDTMSDVLGDASITSELDETIFDDDASKIEDSSDRLASCEKSEQLITLLSMSIIELRNFVDFDDCRYAKEHNQEVPVNWDNHRAREAIRHLVLVIEAAILLGARPERKRSEVENDSINHDMVEATLDGEDAADGGDFEVDIDVVTESRVPVSSLQQHTSISSVLMDLTGDIDSFEKAINETERQAESTDDDSIQDIDAMFSRRPSELSTLRTLIAAWLHTGQAYRVLSVICKAREAILRPFYFADAFMRRGNYVADFTKLLKQLDGIEILVDTTAVLASKCLLVNGGGLDSFERQLMDTIDSNEQVGGNPEQGSGIFKQVGSVRANFVQNREKLTRLATESFNFGKVDFEDSSQAAYRYHQNSQGTAAYLQFNKNNALASSLRTDRQRRLASWHKETSGREKLEMVSRSKGAEKDTLLQRELHHLARFFYSHTNEIMIEPCSVRDASIMSESAANVTVKAIAQRRKIEVPDEGMVVCISDLCSVIYSLTFLL